MPKHKQPTSLYTLCIKESQVLMKTASTNIGKKFGDFRNPQTSLAIEEIQQHLLSAVGSFYLEKIFNTYSVGFFRSLQDTAIFFSICLHANMKLVTIPTGFTSHFDGNTFFMTDAEKNKHFTFLADFWKAHLPRLTQLEHFNLCEHYDNSILQAVGQNCLKLKTLELNSFVTNRGFECLLNCKELKEINVTDEKYGFISTETASLLLRSLPKLESLSCHGLGEALVTLNDVSSLRLVFVEVRAVKPHHVRAISRLCPNIKFLKLVNDNKKFNQMRNASLTALAESDIKVPDLELSDFSFGPEMKCLFTQKGIFITRLKLNADGYGLSLSFSDVYFIGNTCPNLKSLDLDASKIRNDNAQIPTNRVFTLLESLTIEAVEWDYALLQIILTHALNIRSVTFKGGEFDDEDEFEPIPLTLFEVALHKVLLMNPLSELRYVEFWEGAKISVATLLKLEYSCPQLCSIFYR